MLEPWVRPAAFLATFIIMFALETLLPRKRRTESRFQRTWNNLALAVLNSAVVRFVPLLSAVGAAAYAEANGIGVFNWISLPIGIEYLIVLMLLDLIVYWQHVAAHHVPLLWRFHQVHHADHDLDASSGLRFHSLEIALSMAIKCLAVLLLGATPEAVVLFEIVLNSCAMFSQRTIWQKFSRTNRRRGFRCYVVYRTEHTISYSMPATNYCLPELMLKPKELQSSQMRHQRDALTLCDPLFN